MFCKYCGKKVDPENKFCPYCGRQIQEIEKPKGEVGVGLKEEVKTYSSIFWKYFGILILANILIGIFEALEIPIFWIIVLGGYTYFFCRMVNEAMLSIGKKNWWPLGLLALIPLGFWIVFFVVRAQLKPHGKWSLKEGISPWVIVLIVIVIIAIIGILASIVLVSLGGARQRARDARRMADVRQVATALEMYFADNESYPIAYNWSGLEWMLRSYLSPLPTDPLNEEPCVYTYSSDGTDYIITYCLESEGKTIKELTNYSF